MSSSCCPRSTTRPSGAAPDGRGGADLRHLPVYRPRRPAETPLYRVVQHHLKTFLARAEADETRPVPRWTEREFRQYLTCGILAYAFARATLRRLPPGAAGRLQLQGPGRLPVLHEPPDAEVAAHLRDRVIPRVPVRQWVLSVPKRLRPPLARDPDLAGAVLRILLRVIHRVLRDTAGAPLPAEARLGAVSFLHRLGSALNPHPHFHLAVTSGLFAGDPDDVLVFHPARRLDAESARSLSPLVQRRVEDLRDLTRVEADAVAEAAAAFREQLLEVEGRLFDLNLSGAREDAFRGPMRLLRR